MTDQTRANFEAHFQLTTRQAWQHKDGSYKFPEIQSKWEGYLAGVAATPKRRPSMAVDRQFSNLLANYLDAVEFAEADPEALKQAGIARKALTDYLDGLLVAPVAAAAPGDYRDAYEGAREDLLDWKRRALEAEAKLRNGVAVMRTEPKGE